VIAGVFGGLMIMISSLPATPWPLGRTILAVGVFGMLGFFFPQLWLQSVIDRRQHSVRKAMPDALDLLTICVEAGLGFDAAMSKVSEKWENELSVALLRAIREIQLGKPRRDALRDMADRIDISEMTSFIAAVIQSEMLGVSLAKVLRIQSDQMRVKRRQRAEEDAHKAPIKMILPMVFLTFPSILIILLSPAAIQISQSFGAFK
jgi:tight adherence protein C